VQGVAGGGQQGARKKIAGERGAGKWCSGLIRKKGQTISAKGVWLVNKKGRRGARL